MRLLDGLRGLIAAPLYATIVALLDDPPALDHDDEETPT